MKFGGWCVRRCAGFNTPRQNTESIRSIMKWTEMDQGLAEGSYEMASSSWSATGVASPQGIQIAMEEIRAELKLEAAPDPSRAFDWSFVQK